MTMISKCCHPTQPHPFLCTESYPVEKNEPHRLYWGNNLRVMDAIAPEFSGKMDLIYMDPPFTTNSDFAVTMGIGEQEVRLVSSETEKHRMAYTDKDEEDIYWEKMRSCLQKIHGLLSDTGSLFLHCDFRTDWRFRGLLEDIFGVGHVNNQIIWHYTGGGRSKTRFSRKHDVIFWAVKGSTWIFNLEEIRVPYKSTSQYAKHGIVAASGKQYMPHPEGTPVDDVWDIPIINPMSYERVDYPTQKPEVLLERIIRVASRPGDWVGDFFCGSGTTLVVAQRLGRRWLGCDQSHWAIHHTKKRLLTGETRASFVLLEDTQAHPSVCVTKEEQPIADSSLEKPRASFVHAANQDCVFHVTWETRTEREKPAEGNQMIHTLSEVSADWSMVLRLHWTGWESCDGEATPDELAQVMVHWSDRFDSWAVDVSFDGQVFQPHWYVYRTRQQRKLPLCTDWLNISEPAMLCIKAVDVLGQTWMRILPCPL